MEVIEYKASPGANGGDDWWNTETQVRAPHSTDSLPTRWPESPRIVVKCDPCASNGPKHLGLGALQWWIVRRVFPDGTKKSGRVPFCSLETIPGTKGTAAGQVRRDLQPRSLWRIPTAAVG